MYNARVAPAFVLLITNLGLKKILTRGPFNFVHDLSPLARKRKMKHDKRDVVFFCHAVSDFGFVRSMLRAVSSHFSSFYGIYPCRTASIVVCEILKRWLRVRKSFLEKE